MIVAGVFYFLFFSPVFQIKKIIVTGEDKVPQEWIELLVEKKLENRLLFLKTKSIFVIDSGQVEKDILNTFPQIAEVEIGRGLPDAINLLVKERVGVAVWCEDEDCFLLDNEGVVFERLAEADSSLMEIENLTLTEEVNLGEAAISKEIFSKVLEVKSKIEEDLDFLIVKASFVSEERLNLKTSEGWEIYFNLKGDLDWQVQELSLVLEKEIPPECSLAREKGELKYFDLRFSRVYCK